MPLVSPVAILTPAYPPDRGGLALALARLVRRVGARVPLEVVVVQQARTPRLTCDRLDGATVLRVAGPRWEDLQQQAFRLLRERAPYRLLHGVYPSRTGFLITLAARYFSIPALLAARGNDLERDLFRRERQPGLLHALREADLTVGVSRDLCRIAQALGARATRWLPNGVDGERFRPGKADPSLRAHRGLEHAFPIIGFAGEARRKKGLDTLLRAFGLLRQRCPQARLLLLGGVRPEDRVEYERLLDALPEVRAAVIATNWLEQDPLLGHYHLLDLFWHPSSHDGMPNAVLEAMACALPVVATRVGGIADLLSDSAMAPWLIPASSARALAETSLRLLALTTEERARLGAAGRAHVLGRFSAEMEAGAYLAVYDELASPLHPGRG
jgi:glycosyltransferase involved in cell wall biosynthesis